MSEKVKLLDNPLYYIGHSVFRFLFFSLRRCKVYGLENLPESPFIAAPNHASYIDPPLVGASLNRPLFYMAKKELFEIPILGFFLRKVNVIPVNRAAADFGAIKNALKILRTSGCLVIFPAGTRVKSKKTPGALKMGVGFFSVKTQLPVAPVFLKNTDKFLSFKPIEVRWGKPLTPPAEQDKSSYEKFSVTIMDEIEKLSINRAEK